MLYFSELKGKRVVTEQGIHLGRLLDLIFLAHTVPNVTKLLVDGGKNHLYLIPLSYIRRLNSVITIADGFAVESLAPDELYLNKNLLDQQILDITGNKIVRVNDVAIQDLPAQAGKSMQMMIAGVDIGIIGLLRWFGADETFGRLLRLLGTTVTSRFLSWADIQPLQLTRGKVVMRKAENKLSRLMPEDLADHLENMSMRNVTRVLDLMDESLAAEVVENLNITYQQSLFKVFTPIRSAKLIERMDADDAVDILLSLSERKRASIISHLSPEKQKAISRLMTLSKTPIGGLITLQFFTANPEATAGKIKQEIKKKTGDFAALFYVYAVNREGHLLGVSNLHELLLAENDAPLYKFMNPSLVVLHLTTPLEIAMKRMFKYKLEALPVIDDDKKIIGIVTIDDLTESILKRL